MKRYLFLAVIAMGSWLAVGCGSGAGGTSPGQEEAISTPASGDRTVLGVHGIPPGWRKATFGDKTTRSPGVSADEDLLTGTEEGDLIVAGGSAQTIRGLGGDDALSGGGGKDRIYGGPGDDLINAQGDGKRDEIDCGPGHDEVLLDAGDGERPRRCEFEGVSVG